MNDNYANENENACAAERQLPIQRLLGHCLLKLQEYELLLKRTLPSTAISAPVSDVSAHVAAHGSSLRKEMMGNLVGMLTKTVLVSEGTVASDKKIPQDIGNRMWIESRTQVSLENEHYVEVMAGLKELVFLRNELVHHFLEKFELNTKAGCAQAEEFLRASYEKINEHLTVLKAWAHGIACMNSAMSSVLAGKEFRDFLDGINHDGTVVWERSGIVQGLRDAEEKLCVKGWVSLQAAITWLSKNAPEHTPKRYGCVSWRQVLHESRQFEVQKKTPIKVSSNCLSHHSGTVWYRSVR